MGSRGRVQTIASDEPGAPCIPARPHGACRQAMPGYRPHPPPSRCTMPSRRWSIPHHANKSLTFGSPASRCSGMMNRQRRTKRTYLNVQRPGRRDWMVEMSETLNVDPAELKKFDELASRWWDPEGEFKPLHRMNPVRLAYLREGMVHRLGGGRSKSCHGGRCIGYGDDKRCSCPRSG